MASHHFPLADRKSGSWRLRLLFVSNSDFFFLSHRMGLARAAADAGADVFVATPETGRSAEIERAGLNFVPLRLSRRGANPIVELVTIAALLRIYRRLRPHIIHHLTIKPVVYGSIAARAVPDVRVVNAITGLGYVFTSNKAARVLRPLVRPLYRAALGHPRSLAIFQNPEDLSDFVQLRLVDAERAVLIRGSGVDCELFKPAPEPKGDPVVIFASRLIWDKGVGEFVEAARILRKGSAIPVRFVLVGAPDAGNPTAVSESRIREWVREGIVEWWGPSREMPEVLAQASIVALPTKYKEGIPKVLLEAAASGRPLVATDVRGCREIVHPNVNGILVPPGDAAELASAIRSLLENPGLRRRYGEAGRRLAVEEFSEEVVVGATLAVYGRLLGSRARDGMEGILEPRTKTADRAQRSETD